MDARGLSLVEILVATCVLSVGLVALATGLRYAAGAIELGRRETLALTLAEDRLELLRGLARADWGDPRLAAGPFREDYGVIASAPNFRRETMIVDRGGAGCATPLEAPGTCKAVWVGIAYRLAAGGERHVDLWTVLAPRP